MSAPSLPFDIDSRTIQFVYVLLQSHNVDYPTLSACALRLLFRRITPPSDIDAVTDAWLNRAAPLLLRALKSRPHHGTYVRSISIHCIPNRVELLRRCPHIALLHLIGDVPLPLAREGLHTLRMPSLRPSALVASMSDNHDLVHAVPSWSARPLILTLPLPTQLLSITSRYAIDVRQLCVTVPDAEIQLEDLNIGGDSVFPPADLLGLPTVNPSVTSSLHALVTEELPSNAVLKELKALESLIIRKFPISFIPLPRTLLHFGVHEHHDYASWLILSPMAPPLTRSIAGIAAALSEPPNLQVVSVTRCSHHAVRYALREASAACGVELVEYPDPQSYPGARYVDWLS
ncbi:hypothetical protein FA95DRAFT_1577982 [Auriscalpium vulgare]|uniref:Uncharacterized protein n=1 Tax=Auriscalpium vulgare TaxID=40419 RepID=A0ACB8R4J6_9AGAM|nr:hypothetical protein FA95DRAFT_1577982 [Auriscalpium vulgare]